MGVVTTDTESGRNLCTYRINKQSELLKLIRILIDNHASEFCATPKKGVKSLDFSNPPLGDTRRTLLKLICYILIEAVRTSLDYSGINSGSASIKKRYE